MSSLLSHLKQTGYPPYPAFPSPVDIGATCPLSDSWVTPIVKIPEEPTTSHTPTVLFPYIGAHRCEQPIRSKNHRRTTIDNLPEEILLEVFDFYRLEAMGRSRGGRPWKWHRLTHVCQRWRYVVSISPRRLRLQITCKSGAPIEPILDTWPTLPIVVRYKGSRKPKRLPNNIVAAFRHPDRICDIDIGVTSSVLESMVDATQRPFPLLERVHITSNDLTGESVLPSPGNFMGGSTPRLQNVYLDGIVFPFPELRQLLLSSNHLVEIRLCNITDAGYFSPHALVSGLSALARLKRLEIHFHRSTSIPTQRDADPPPPLERASLPSLTFLAFHGISKYLEGVVARIDFPSLTFVIIKFLNEFIFEIPHLCRFIGRVDALKSPNEVIVKPSQDNSSITFTQRGERRRNLGELFLVISGGPLDWQLSSTTQIFTQLSPLLSNVKVLAFGKYPSAPAVEEDVDPTQWLELFQPFRSVWNVRVTEKLVPDVALALGGLSDDAAPGVLPALITLTLEGHRDHPFVQDAAQRFVAQRQILGRRIYLLG